ncbi:hypothetical protein HU200_064587 [Digitaria exilis]|uniref:Uncharacterized protein n=1 Tax=Digitaria exilis TaxID=1010633 RepID=A0A834ZZU0_9POAL|nr:hypothetical protein HU200_064587 [Digitaria exilis]
MGLPSPPLISTSTARRPPRRGASTSAAHSTTTTAATAGSSAWAPSGSSSASPPRRFSCCSTRRAPRRNASSVEEANELIEGFNARLAARLDDLRPQLPGADVVFCDVYKGMMEIISNPGRYGKLIILEQFGFARFVIILE